MRRAERLFRLVFEMRARGISRACDLASYLEVSERTIYRDIAHLQASGLPIEGEAGVGYVLRPGFDLPNMTFTHEQIEALAIGLSFVESFDDPELAAAASEVRAKLQAGLPDPAERRLTEAPYFSLRRRMGEASHAKLLRKSIRKRQIIELTYQDQDHHHTERRVHPLAVLNFETGWMFCGWCELRNDFRSFRFDRIIKLTATDAYFDHDETKSLRAFLERERCGIKASQ